MASSFDDIRKMKSNFHDTLAQELTDAFKKQQSTDEFKKNNVDSSVLCSLSEKLHLTFDEETVSFTVIPIDNEEQLELKYQVMYYFNILIDLISDYSEKGFISKNSWLGKILLDVLNKAVPPSSPVFKELGLLAPDKNPLATLSTTIGLFFNIAPKGSDLIFQKVLSEKNNPSPTSTLFAACKNYETLFALQRERVLHKDITDGTVKTHAVKMDK